MPDSRKQRGVTLNADAYARIEQAASAAGESVAAYVTKAAEDRRRREAAAAYAAYVSQPEIAAQVTQFRAAVAPVRAAAWRAAGADAA